VSHKSGQSEPVFVLLPHNNRWRAGIVITESVLDKKIQPWCLLCGLKTRAEQKPPPTLAHSQKSFQA